MTNTEQNDQLDRLVRRAFDAPVPLETRAALQHELRKTREAWQARARRPRVVLAVFRHGRGLAWAAAAAGLVAAALGGAYAIFGQHRTRTSAPTVSYACATASRPVSFARCTAVFYAADRPHVWVVRRTIDVDAEGTVMETVAYNTNKGDRS